MGEGMTEQSSNPAMWAGIEPPEGHELAWKVVRPDGRTRGDFRWPFKGVARVPKATIRDHSDPCPWAEGDGLCLAKSWQGATSGGIAAVTGLAIAYRAVDVLGEDDDKLRVHTCRVLEVLDLQRLLREGHGKGANLTGANLTGANLTRANLTRANLHGANLTRANLTGAYLHGAYLHGANLTRANLHGANLHGAYLHGANLHGAYLHGAINVPAGAMSDLDHAGGA